MARARSDPCLQSAFLSPSSDSASSASSSSSSQVLSSGSAAARAESLQESIRLLNRHLRSQELLSSLLALRQGSTFLSSLPSPYRPSFAMAMLPQMDAAAEILTKASSLVMRISTDAHLYDDPDDVNIRPLLEAAMTPRRINNEFDDSDLFIGSSDEAYLIKRKG